MESLLLKLARQLDAIDEASLTALWSKYAQIAAKFEPTKRWEQACLVLGFISAKHMKNRLFNHYWSQQQKPYAPGEEPSPQDMFPQGFTLEEPKERKPCRVIPFKLPESKEK